MAERVSEAELEREFLMLRRRIVRLGRPLRPDEADEVAKEAASIRERLADHLIKRMVVNRPEVVSRGGAFAHVLARRALEEARRRLRRKREFREARSSCPAASVVRRVDGDVAVRCAVEQHTLTSRSDPQSVLTFCLGDHEGCPSWRAEKERVWAGKRLPLVEAV